LKINKRGFLVEMIPNQKEQYEISELTDPIVGYIVSSLIITQKPIASQQNKWPKQHVMAVFKPFRPMMVVLKNMVKV